MIINYQFDNANDAGNKEAVIVPNPPTLVNKLSANETNKIKDKINEIIPFVNANMAVPYLDLRLKAKGEGNSMDTLQIGDVVTGWADAETFWNSAIYEGGDVNDRENYTPINEGVSPEVIALINNKIDKPSWAGYEQQYMVISSESNINLRPITITPNYIGYWTGNTFFTSIISQQGGNIGISTSSTPTQKLQVNGNIQGNKYYYDISTANSDPLKDWTDGSKRFFTNSGGEQKQYSFGSSFIYTPTGDFTMSTLKSAVESAGMIFNGLVIYINLGSNNYICTLNIGANNINTSGVIIRSGSGSLSFASNRSLDSGINNIVILNGNQSSFCYFNFMDKDYIKIKNY